MDIVTVEKFYYIKSSLIEMKSSMILLQQAIQNEYNRPQLSDIDNNLEILVEKFEKIITAMSQLETEISDKL